jgi:hypothetical protein
VSALGGLSLKAVDMPHGYPEPGVAQVSFGKTTPQTATGNLFTVAGTIQASLVGVISTALGAVAQHLTMGVTGSPAALAAAQAVALNATAAGAVILLPKTLGAAFPAPLVAGGAPASCSFFTVSNTIITLTSDASTTGAITWILHWVSLSADASASVTTN